MVTIEYWDTLTPCRAVRTPGGKMLVPGPPEFVRRRVFPEFLQSLDSWKKQGRRKSIACTALARIRSFSALPDPDALLWRQVERIVAARLVLQEVVGQ